MVCLGDSRSNNSFVIKKMIKQIINKYDNVIEKNKMFSIIIGIILLLLYLNSGRSGLDAIIFGLGIGAILIVIGIIALIVPGISNISGIFLIIIGAAFMFIGPMMQSFIDMIPGGMVGFILGAMVIVILITAIGRRR